MHAGVILRLYCVRSAGWRLIKAIVVVGSMLFHAETLVELKSRLSASSRYLERTSSITVNLWLLARVSDRG